MTIKKMISAFCLAAGLVIAAPAAASVTGLPQGTAATVQAAVKNGWQKDATGMYYLKNGRRVTGKPADAADIRIISIRRAIVRLAVDTDRKKCLLF